MKVSAKKIHMNQIPKFLMSSVISFFFFIAGFTTSLKSQANSSGTLCTVTINSDNEKKVFSQNYEKAGFKTIELTLLDSENSGQTETALENQNWFDRACQSGIKCDVLLISGHFGGYFFGSSGLTLPIDQLEKHSCNNDCTGILKDPKEVYLFGCNTLAGKEPDQRTQAQYVRALTDDGIERATAEQIAATRYSPISSSFFDSMRRIFQGAKVIYGNKSKGPLGKQIEPKLIQYFKTKKVSLDSLEKQTTDITQHQIDKSSSTQLIYNPEFMSALKGTAMTQTTGISKIDENYKIIGSICKFRNSKSPRIEKLKAIQQSIEEGNLMAFVPAILDFFNSMANLNRKRFTEEELIVLQKVFENKEIKATLLKTADLLMQPTVQIKLYEFFLKVNWLNKEDANKKVGLVVDKIIKNLTHENADTFCSLPVEQLKIAQNRKWVKDPLKLTSLEQKIISCAIPNKKFNDEIVKLFEIKLNQFLKTQNYKEIFNLFYQFHIDYEISTKEFEQKIPINKKFLEFVFKDYYEFKSELNVAFSSEFIEKIELEHQKSININSSNFSSLCDKYHHNFYFDHLPDGFKNSDFIKLTLGYAPPLECVQLPTIKLKELSSDIITYLLNSPESVSNPIKYYESILPIKISDEKIYEQLKLKFDDEGYFRRVFVLESKLKDIYDANKKKALKDYLIKNRISNNIEIDTILCFDAQHKTEFSNSNLFWEDYSDSSPSIDDYELLKCLPISKFSNFRRFINNVYIGYQSHVTEEEKSLAHESFKFKHSTDSNDSIENLTFLIYAKRMAELTIKNYFKNVEPKEIPNIINLLKIYHKQPLEKFILKQISYLNTESLELIKAELFKLIGDPHLYYDLYESSLSFENIKKINQDPDNIMAINNINHALEKATTEEEFYYLFRLQMELNNFNESSLKFINKLLIQKKWNTIVYENNEDYAFNKVGRNWDSKKVSKILLKNLIAGILDKSLQLKLRLVLFKILISLYINDEDIPFNHLLNSLDENPQTFELLESWINYYSMMSNPEIMDYFSK